MGNLGIDQTAVNIAANSLFREGKPVTISSVRHRIGSGSFTTVAKYLAIWKSNQAMSEAIPPMTEMYQKQMSKLWELVYSEVEKSFEEKKLQMEQEKITWEEERKSFMHEIEKLEIDNLSKVEQSKKMEATFKNAKTDYEQRLASGFRAELEIPKLQEKIVSLESRLEDATKRAERLENQLIEIAKAKK